MEYTSANGITTGEFLFSVVVKDSSGDKFASFKGNISELNSQYLSVTMREVLFSLSDIGVTINDPEIEKHKADQKFIEDYKKLNGLS